MNRRGMTFIEGAIILALGLLVVGGVLVGMEAFKTTIDCGAAYDVLGDSLDLFKNFGDQLGTVGTMLGVGMIIAIIGLAFLGVSYGRKKGYF